MPNPSITLSQPPIVEVACGFHFTSIPELDPLVIGKYWDQRKETYPSHAIHAAIDDGGVPLFSFGALLQPSRVWFISKDDQFVIQIQHDRFYLNWRYRNENYPSFSGRSNKSAGLKSLFITEFNEFRDFLRSYLKTDITPQRAELIKIDHLHEEQHWKGIKDLGVAIPHLSPLLSFASSDEVNLSTQFTERSQGQNFLLSMALNTDIAPENKALRFLRIEFKLVRDLDKSCEEENWQDHLSSMNDEINSKFFTIIPSSQLHQRFGVTEGGV